jgi:hypothetical protein
MAAFELLVDVSNQIMNYWMGSFVAGVHGNHGEGKILDCFSNGHRKLYFHDLIAFWTWNHDNREFVTRGLGVDCNMGQFYVTHK